MRCRKCGGELVAHFAGFPTALPELLIRAATSERGYCAKCGNPWARLLKRCRNVQQEERVKSRAAKPKGDCERATAPDDALREVYETVGWRPTCRCDNAGEPVPGVVLDPFLGTGSTALAAERLGRRWIGIELNANYCALARHRLAEVQGIFHAA
jgi:hypothetical protein